MKTIHRKIDIWCNGCGEWVEIASKSVRISKLEFPNPSDNGTIIYEHICGRTPHKLLYQVSN